MYVTVRVKDDGIGMSPEDCEKVFDEFYRARNEQTASIPGTGLGPEPREAADRAAPGRGLRGVNPGRGQRVHRQPACPSISRLIPAQGLRIPCSSVVGSKANAALNLLPSTT